MTQKDFGPRAIAFQIDSFTDHGIKQCYLSDMTSIIEFFILNICAVLLSACSTITPKQVNKPEIISLKTDFEMFAKQPQKNDDSEFFASNQVLFKSVVYPEIKDKPQAIKERKIRLIQFLNENDKNSQATIEAFSNLEATAGSAINEFKHKFPNGDYDYKIYFLPSLLRFSGRAEVQGDDSVTVAFGADNIARNGEKISVLFAHEMFHALHFKTLKLTKAEFERFQVDPIAVMWLEGFASFESAKVNNLPSTPSAVFKKLGIECERQTDRLQRIFTADVKSHLVFDEKLLDKWFGSGVAKDNIPPMAGYCIGLSVLNEISNSYSEQELLEWNPLDKKNQILRVLEGFR